jgi:hypothetical protein
MSVDCGDAQRGPSFYWSVHSEVHAMHVSEPMAKSQNRNCAIRVCQLYTGRGIGGCLQARSSIVPAYWA